MENLVCYWKRISGKPNLNSKLAAYFSGIYIKMLYPKKLGVGNSRNPVHLNGPFFNKRYNRSSYCMNHMRRHTSKDWDHSLRKCAMCSKCLLRACFHDIFPVINWNITPTQNVTSKDSTCKNVIQKIFVGFVKHLLYFGLCLLFVSLFFTCLLWHSGVSCYTVLRVQ